MNAPAAARPRRTSMPRPRPTDAEMHNAREVQARLLPPRAPRLETLSCHGRSLAARGIGGDYFDFLHPGSGRLALALGDISGKGISAALMMASFQACLRSHYAAAAGDLRRLLRSVNRLHFECTAPQHYASLFLGEYDDATRRLRYANCGHNPALLVRADGGVDRLAATATVVGMFREWDCAVAEVVISPDDTLLLFTDGATEAADPAGEPFGEARLLGSLLRYRDLPLPVSVDSMLRDVRSFARGHRADDVTILLARGVPRENRREEGQRA